MPTVDLDQYILKGERLIPPDDARVRYIGRVDDESPREPSFQFVMSGFAIRLKARKCSLVVSNTRQYWQSSLGVIVNGSQHRLPLPESGAALLELPLEGGADVCDITVFKRMDACHAFTLCGIIVDAEAELLQPREALSRCIEVYGDSISAGEVVEAVEYTGKPDPEHDGGYSNGYWSYAAQTARMLGAELSDIAQGGISLQDGTGYFGAPNTLGMLSCYDKVAYNPELGRVKPWDFSRYRPDVVVVAIGQNDAHPVNFMAEDYGGELARGWRKDYARFVRLLRGQYPDAAIILTTTILNHDPRWDDAIAEAARELRDSNAHHFLYSRNGAGTPGHVRIGEAEEMARELSAFILSLGMWDDK